MSKKKIVLSCLFQANGYHKAGWRLPEAEAGADTNIDYYIRTAQRLEEGLFDLFFIADTPATRTEYLDTWTKSPIYQNGLEPITVLTALALHTKHIGLGGTVSTSFFEPFNIARQFAALDHISKGRVAWNVVTSANDYAARNFGLERLPPHGERYEKAKECVELVKAYWDTWEDDAFIFDKANAMQFDPNKYHVVDHQGKFFKVYGGLNVARSPQGHPVIIQAGASDAGKELAAETAEIVFGTGSSMESAKAFYDDLKGRMAKYGRDTSQFNILSGFDAVIGDTEKDAEDKFQYLQSLVPPELAVLYLSMDLETNLLDLPLDEPVPLDRIPKTSNNHTIYFNQISELINSGRTLREISTTYRRGNRVMRGTAEQVADFMEKWVDAGCGDGFMMPIGYYPGNLDDYIDKVIPILQERGSYKTEYTGTTLRDNLGLIRPANRYAAG
ncbi:LLM class flavin-dependent oxidoreductase [Rhizobium sp. TRM95111]|uniref:LLM class flavin-dependent oxidoreductase n=1 Tax=Rhizobium alarense TaxID=2846851 RepID=UPI001F239597|nr:LLM class flavin-dependent oxidoreductase [Rhizobium alarense]MCF3641607.1 LLM class flavin-dependent oxidoreductase [Rhizobium alarense]